MKGEIFQIPRGFRTHDLVNCSEPSNPHKCTSLLSSRFGKETIYKITYDFIVDLFNNTSRNESVSYYLKYIDKKKLVIQWHWSVLKNLRLTIYQNPVVVYR